MVVKPLFIFQHPVLEKMVLRVLLAVAFSEILVSCFSYFFCCTADCSCPVVANADFVHSVQLTLSLQYFNDSLSTLIEIKLQTLFQVV